MSMLKCIKLCERTTEFLSNNFSELQQQYQRGLGSLLYQFLLFKAFKFYDCVHSGVRHPWSKHFSPCILTVRLHLSSR